MTKRHFLICNEINKKRDLKNRLIHEMRFWWTRQKAQRYYVKQGGKMGCDEASDRVTSSLSCSSSFPRALDGQGIEHPKANNKRSNQTRKAIKHRLWNNKQTWQQQQQLKETKGGRVLDIKRKTFVYLFNKKSVLLMSKMELGQDV